jgi:hypothetical protein
LNLAFCYHKLGEYNSSIRTLLFLLNELNLEMFEAITEGIKVDLDVPASECILVALLPKLVYRLCLSLRELKLYEKCSDKMGVALDYLKKIKAQLEQANKFLAGVADKKSIVVKARKNLE